MQSGEPNETLGVEAYRVVPLGEPVPFKIECLTTCDDLLLVGTSDSRLVVYRTEAKREEATNSSGSDASSPSSSLTLLQEITDPRRHAVRALTTIGDRHLLALVGDTIALYRLHREPSRSLQLREVTAIAGLKDTISFHVQQQKGLLSLAVLQRRRLAIYEATFAHLEFLLREAVTLPDGVRSFGWLGRSFLLGGRKEYFLYHTSSSSSTALYPTPRSGATPFVLPMAPIPEVLVAGDGGGMRALLSDGGEVPGDSRVRWTTPPVSLSYEHPYVVSQHSTGPHTLQVHLPLLTTLEESTVPRKNSLVQYIDIPKLAKVSQCLWTDYDCPMPTKATATNALARHPIVAANTSNRLFLLARTAIAAQAETLAARKLFAAADLLCQLCPHEVREETLTHVVVAGAMYRFLTLQDYAGCFHELSRIDADPRLAIQLFPGFLRREEAATCPLLSTTPPPTPVQAALPALVAYLQSRRINLLLRGQSLLTTEAARGQLACIDRALVLAWCALEAEAPLLALLQAENWCAVEDTAAVLREHEQWVALTVLQEVKGDYDEAAAELGRLVGAAVVETGAWNGLPTEVVVALQSFFAEHRNLPTSDEVYLPQSTILDWAASLQEDSPWSRSSTVANALIGVVTALTFFRRRALPPQQKLFAQHLTWVLGWVPPDNALRIFFSAQNVQQYAAVLRLLQNYTEMPGCTSKQLLRIAYLQLLFADTRVRVSEAALYEQYYKGLGDLLFAAPPSAPSLAEADRQRFRSRLDELLLTSSHVDLDAAEQYFNADAIKTQCVPERALIYRRRGAHRRAAEMFLDETDDMEGAIAYAKCASSENAGDAFTSLLELLLKPRHGAPRVAEALTILNTCDGVDAALVLPMLPADLPLAQLSSFLLHAFRSTATTYHMSAMDNSVLKAKLMSAQETHVRELSRSAVLEDATVCPVCQRKIRPDTVLAVYPNGLLVHQGCMRDEHVCPATHRDYRYDAYSLLEDL
ncbi:hypothetical protein ABB37_08222 [Leptomonas pyrrhocoris]|uniref:CNH domain-containing protein n=1 Tax=Leptomonas pyrrhocoris TaxID=157538 RepID=A0A0M9FTC3_LEPPY|nr:hypothetical protein ABB37_08222 [Leptomonas pyrrhocoris]XP_015654094.1 hypothetical protein ABB37_08222 [Leptomonas pyrrhocoris]KPA75654.1 hypothetical protein ABB37_08222 [Leptomonas pyrrhocoris]KPA75655.1 hypothetical protein ABB37_08222 [Leptomonas pyrrhocoris]|eukprot:XP_015654093.1 hypothetical protein ABB37_08222 [Leptomonas pyrrhocoris]